MQYTLIHFDEVSQFEKIISAGRLNRTFLILGGKDSGKTYIALKFAEKILGNSKKTNPNLQFFQGSKGEFKDKVEDFLSACEKAPFSGNHNVVVFDDFDKIPQLATNSLLKTIEEPLERTTIILTASSKDSLLDTIISRSFIFNLRQYTYEEKREILWSKGIKDSKHRLRIVDDIKLCLSDNFIELENKAKKVKAQFKQLQKCPDDKLISVIEDIIQNTTPKFYFQSIRSFDESLEFQKHVSDKLSKAEAYATPFLVMFSHAMFLRNEYKRLKEAAS